MTSYALAGAFFCGLIAWVQAVAKSRSSWWFLAGLFVPVFTNLLLAVATDLDRERQLHEGLDDVLDRLRVGEFYQAVRIGRPEGVSLCAGCSQFRSETAFCGAFRRNVRMKIEGCERFVASVIGEQSASS